MYTVCENTVDKKHNAWLVCVGAASPDSIISSHNTKQAADEAAKRFELFDKKRRQA
jgi:hypothetical protein